MRVRAEQEFMGGMRPDVDVTARHRAADERDSLPGLAVMAHPQASVTLALVSPGLLDGSADEEGLDKGFWGLIGRQHTYMGKALASRWLCGRSRASL